MNDVDRVINTILLSIISIGYLAFVFGVMAVGHPKSQQERREPQRGTLETWR